MSHRGRGRPPKFTPEELRDRLITSARSSLRQRGPGCGLDAVTLDDAITDAEVPRGSAYQLWQHETLTPQVAFRQAVAHDILRSYNDRGRVAIEAMKESLDDLNSHLEGTIEERRWAFSQVTRQVVNQSFEQLTSSQGWRVYNALRAAMLGKSPRLPFAIDAIERGERQLVDSLAEVATTVADTHGFRLRSPYTMEDFVEAVLMMTEGSGTRLHSSEMSQTILRPTGADGEMQEWTLLAVGVEALIHAFFEVADID